MRIIVLILMCFLSNGAFCQLADEFSDGELLTNPPWLASGNGNDFTVDQGQLRSNSTVLNSNFYISAGSALAMDCKWEFKVNLKFNTSGANYVDVYLISSKQDLKSTSINGYFLRIGNTDDDICLYRRTGTLASAIKILDGVNGITNSSSTTLKVRIIRDDAGIFSMEWDAAGLGTYTPGGNVKDLTHTSGGWFGIYIQQSTASFIQEHFFDDFTVGPLVRDTDPPMLTKVIVADSSRLEVYFNEPIDGQGLNPLNYVLDKGYDSPQGVEYVQAGAYYNLTFATPFQSGQYRLTIRNVRDLKGNLMTEAFRDFFFIKPYAGKKGDVVINEIFPDPSPPVGLPAAEYIELWNTSAEYVLLKGWKYADLTTTYTFGADTLKPNQLLILSAKADEALFSGSGSARGISPWPTLNNDKDLLKLSNAVGLEIDKVAYSDTWYKDEVKKTGGYSLERIDPANLCTGIQNWEAGKSTAGGTPGLMNSVYQTQRNNVKPFLVSAALKDSITVELEFNKSIDSAFAADIVRYSFNNGIGNPVLARPEGPYFAKVTLQLNAPVKRGMEHTLTVTGIRDCGGNEIAAGKGEAKIFLAEKIRHEDILITEALFNPRLGSVDFIEIYNKTDHLLDLRDLKIGNADSSGRAANLKIITVLKRYIPPKSYFVLTPDTASVKANYHTENPDNFIKMSLPSYLVAAGTVVLFADGKETDRLDYREAMHVSLMKDAKGVSLERISFERTANAPGNFTSSSATAGYATPAYRNSVAENQGQKIKSLVAAKVFSPDGDGLDDALEISYSFDLPGKMGTINIYNDLGVLQRRLIKNHNLATAGKLVWDGLNDKGQRCKIGIYLLRFDVFDLTGKIELYKELCVLAGKF